MLWAAFILVGFACGSIPFGLYIARARGVDIRKHGSGNIGATNVARVLGRRAGLVCFALDVLKGFIPTFIAGLAAGTVHASVHARSIAEADAWLWLAVVGACVLGHIFTPLAGFKGGKGVATGLGAMLGVWPYLALPAIGALALWVAVASLWRYVSLASCIAALSLPLFIFANSLVSPVVGNLAPFYIGTSAMGLLVVYRHRANIRRLFSGTENRFGRPLPPP